MSQSAKRGGDHPTISRESAEFSAWHEYFDAYLGGRPHAFRLLLEGSILSMTMPELLPQWFDPSFTPTPGWRGSTEQPRSEGRMIQMERANVLVHRAAPQYDAMVARSKAQGASDQDWRQDDQGRGIWVAYGWLDDEGDRRLGNAVARVARVARRA